MRSRVEQAEVGRLATVTDGARPHLVPCCFVLVGDTVYTGVDAKPKSRVGLQRVENVRANPYVSLLVDHYDRDWSRLWWIRLDGVGRVVSEGSDRDVAIGALTDKYPQYETVSIPGPIIVIDVHSWRGWP